jgi:hypothetical protein
MARLGRRRRRRRRRRLCFGKVGSSFSNEKFCGSSGRRRDEHFSIANRCGSEDGCAMHGRDDGHLSVTHTLSLSLSLSRVWKETNARLKVRFHAFVRENFKRDFLLTLSKTLNPKNTKKGDFCISKFRGTRHFN